LGKPNLELEKSYPSTNSWVRNYAYHFPNFTCALSKGLLRRMQLSNAYTRRRVYSGSGENSVALPEHFDPDPIFHFDTTPDPDPLI
jgi:hypothetical protein